jgi:hypothetical protein
MTARCRYFSSSNSLCHDRCACNAKMDITTAVVNCKQCAEPEPKFSAITVAVVVVIAIIAIYYLLCIGVTAVRRAREGFISPRAYEVCAQSRDLFSKSKDKTTYSEYKTIVPGADPVMFADVKKLWADGSLSPRNVQNVL